MFSGSGHQILGGTFYNVGGDVNIQTRQHLTIQDHQTQHLMIQDHRAAPLPEDSRVAGSHRPLMIGDNGPYWMAGAGLGADGQSAESQHELAGVVRNTRRGMTVMSAPYGESEIRD
jgi:hypothetical protein